MFTKGTSTHVPYWGSLEKLQPHPARERSLSSPGSLSQEGLSCPGVAQVQLRRAGGSGYVNWGKAGASPVHRPELQEQ